MELRKELFSLKSIHIDEYRMNRYLRKCIYDQESLLFKVLLYKHNTVLGLYFLDSEFEMDTNGIKITKNIQHEKSRSNKNIQD